jgi:hypothetical protein
MPHSLDVMHITKNVCESLLGTLLNMPDRTQDRPKARHDLEFMKIREDLHLDDPMMTMMMRIPKVVAREKGPRGMTITAPLRASL